MKSNTKNNNIFKIIFIILILIFCIGLCYLDQKKPYIEPSYPNKPEYIEPTPIVSYTLDTIPEYSETMENAYVIINNDVPDFSSVISTMDVSKPFSKYSYLDSEEERAGTAIANVCNATIAKEDNTSININPTGWQSISGDFNNNGTIDWLYNRSHLIAYVLTGDENDERNIITATDYTNKSSMKIFENKIVSYVKNNPNEFVLYRVTPIYEGENLVASGIHMEAMSINSNEDIPDFCFNVYVYNIQKGVTIDYSTGKAEW